ncbi:MAG: hypothetical protein CVV46_09530 [Spirochaetae bacterium HGW-Spirochaetae-2]|nr:MAG: hypothetical protein CVV46_09530 [Spirochaetae bacterium HGW-Spirochaetae-2]
MLRLQRFQRWIVLLLPAFYLMGFLFHLWDATFPLMLAMTPYTILGTAILGFLPDVVTRNRKLLLWAAGTFAITLFLEILGVATGAVFGSYTYGPTLGFPVMDVPLLIGINWTLIIMGAAMLVERLTNNPWQVALGTAAITVVFDWIMEPVAIALDYWSWSSSTIPLQNYIAWFVIAFVFATIFSRMKLKTASPIPSLIVVVQALFFSLLRLLVI